VVSAAYQDHRDIVQPSSYVEPFCRGGAVFFAFEWPNAAISDVNEELMAHIGASQRTRESWRKASVPTS